MYVKIRFLSTLTSCTFEIDDVNGNVFEPAAINQWIRMLSIARYYYETMPEMLRPKL